MGHHSTVHQKGAAGQKSANDGVLQKKKSGNSSLQGALDAMSMKEVSPLVHDVLHSPGQPLEPRARSFFEPRLRHSFGHVRIHKDEKAAESAQKVNALAYTVGSDIVFGAGKYAPSQSEGRRLLAHELTHVVQQGNPVNIPERLSIDADRDSEQEADRMAEAVMSPARTDHLSMQGSREPVVAMHWFGPSPVQRLMTPVIARETQDTEFPGMSQADFISCGAASLISALMIWDKERKDPNTPSTILIAACNATLVFQDNHKDEIIARINKISLDGQTGRGQEMYDICVNSVRLVRDLAIGTQTTIPETAYQVLAKALLIMFMTKKDGLSTDQMRKIQDMLGIKTNKTDAGSSFDDLMDKLSGLQAGQTAQVDWYYRGNKAQDGSSPVTHHAFLTGRFQRGAWYISDQGSNPPTELEASSLDLLKSLIKANTATRDQGVYTGDVSTITFNGFKPAFPELGHVMVLSGGTAVTTNARDIIMRPGDFIAEVDASLLSSGDRIIAWDFVDRVYDLEKAKTAMNEAGTGSGGVILEKPLGLFHVFKTSLVSDTNVNETKIDEGDSKNGKVTPANKIYKHAWLQLRSSTKTGSFFQVY